MFHKQEAVDLVQMVAHTAHTRLEKFIAIYVYQNLLLIIMVAALCVALIVKHVKHIQKTAQAVTTDNFPCFKQFQVQEHLFTVNLMQAALLRVVQFAQISQQKFVMSVYMDTTISKAIVQTVLGHVEDVIILFKMYI